MHRVHDRLYSDILHDSESIRRFQWPSGLRRGSAADRLLEVLVRIPLAAWMSVVSVVCCKVEVSVTGRSIVQRVLPTVVCHCV